MKLELTFGQPRDGAAGLHDLFWNEVGSGLTGSRYPTPILTLDKVLKARQQAGGLRGVFCRMGSKALISCPYSPPAGSFRQA
jgi:hypothetical protein